MALSRLQSRPSLSNVTAITTSKLLSHHEQTLILSVIMLQRNLLGAQSVAMTRNVLPCLHWREPLHESPRVGKWRCKDTPKISLGTFAQLVGTSRTVRLGAEEHSGLKILPIFEHPRLEFLGEEQFSTSQKQTALASIDGISGFFFHIFL